VNQGEVVLDLDGLTVGLYVGLTVWLSAFANASGYISAASMPASRDLSSFGREISDGWAERRG
jgi:hypothetical protein